MDKEGVVNDSITVQLRLAKGSSAQLRSDSRGETSIISSSNATREAAPDVVAEPSDDMMPADLDWEVCTLCDAFGRPGRLALATAVCDTCGYDPYGYYDDQPFEVLR